MINFTKEQIENIVRKYKEGKTLKQISEEYSVSRPTIQRVVRTNYPEYIGKKRISVAEDGQLKVCTKCRRELPLNKFNNGNSKYGKRSICKECEHKVQNTPERVARRRELEKIRRLNPEYVEDRNQKDKNRRYSNEESYKKFMLNSAKSRAKRKNLEFNIDISDIILPDECPLLHIKLSINSDNKDYTYSLDRIDSSKGYVKGNVWVISFKANRIKNNATLQELETLVSNLKILKGKQLNNNYNGRTE